MASSTRSRTKSTVDSTAVDTGEFAGQVSGEEFDTDNIPTDILVSRTFNDEQLRSITSFEDAITLTQETHGDIADATTVLGNGFRVLDTKEKFRLVGLKMLMMDWTFHNGDNGTFVSIYCAVKNDEGGLSKYVLNDGSSGIMNTLAKYSDETGKYGGLFVEGGLRESKYTYCNECRKAVDPTKDAEHARPGVHTQAATYYLAV